jgi:hypothetical protein
MSSGKRSGWRCYEAKKAWDKNSESRKEYQKKYGAEYYRRTGGVSQRRAWVKRYGLTLEEFEEKRDAQGGVCPGCGNECSVHPNLSIDHCHESGRNRNLLCHNCNRGLGLLGDDPERLEFFANYVRRWRAIHAQMDRDGVPIRATVPADREVERRSRAPKPPAEPPSFTSVRCGRGHLLITINRVAPRDPEDVARSCKACSSGLKKVGRYAKRGITLDPDKTCDEMYAVILGDAPRPRGGRPKGVKNTAPRSDKGIRRSEAPAEV